MISRVRVVILCILLAAIPGLECINQAHAETPVHIPQTAEILVVNSRDSLIMAYAPHANGNIAPAWVMGWQLIPCGIARDSAGRIYVTNYWNNSISVFAPGAEGAASPVAIIRGSKTGLYRPTGIAVDSKGKVYVVNGGADFDLTDPVGRIDIYTAGSSGNVAPIAVIAGNHTRIENPHAVALDSSGKIYVTDSGDEEIETKSPPRVMVYSAGSKGNVSPTSTISGERTDLWFPYGITLDTSGKIYVTNNASMGGHFGAPDDDYDDRVTVYPAGAKGNIAPVARIAGKETGIGQPRGIALDSFGRAYVTNECVRRFEGDPHKSLRDQLACWQSVTVYPVGASGDAAPIATVWGSSQPR